MNNCPMCESEEFVTYHSVDPGPRHSFMACCTECGWSARVEPGPSSAFDVVPFSELKPGDEWLVQVRCRVEDGAQFTNIEQVSLGPDSLVLRCRRASSDS